MSLSRRTSTANLKVLLNGNLKPRPSQSSEWMDYEPPTPIERPTPCYPTRDYGTYFVDSTPSVVDSTPVANDLVNDELIYSPKKK